ncbi:hypothetical protein FGO68_gene8437 [Halteria grandinella]|uniref:Uncharacterized protein n=1 Tax=Halteria grandinella TaxID=5974 RepID=A0A8J8P8X5_HALGN|nr:hypothetical protein FGO68_gene8437 [Halteria grandinella]
MSVYKNSTDIEHIVTVQNNPPGGNNMATFVFRFITYDNNVLGSSDTPIVHTFLHEPAVLTGVELQCMAILQIDYNTLYLLTYEQNAGSYVFQYTLDFNGDTTAYYFYVDPQVSGKNIVNGLFLREQDIFTPVVLSALTIGTVYSPLGLTPSRRLSLLEAFDPERTCFAQDNPGGQDANKFRYLNADTFLDSDDSLLYNHEDSSDITFINGGTQYQATPLPIEEFTSFACVCGMHPEIEVDPSQSGVSPWYVLAGQSSTQTLKVKDFTYTWRSGGTCMVNYGFTYTATYPDGSPLQAPYSFDPLTNSLQVTNLQSTTAVELIVKGTIIELAYSEVIFVTIQGIENLGAPYFVPSLPHAYVEAGNQFIYEVPQAIDPDDDPYTISYDFGQALAICNVMYGNVIQITPAANMAGQVYQIVVILTDQNQFPQSRNLTFLIFIKDTTVVLDTSRKDCAKEPFPKFIGTKILNNVQLFYSAFNPASNSFAVGGHTNSKSLVSYTPAQNLIAYPLIALYSGYHWQRDWLKYLADANGYAVFGMAFSPQGYSLAIHCEKLEGGDPMLTLLTSNGMHISTRKYTNTNLRISMQYNRMVIDEYRSVIVMAKKQADSASSLTGSTRRYVIFRIAQDSIESSWALTSVTDGQAFNIVQSESVNAIYVQAMHYEGTSSNAFVGKLTRIRATSPTLSWISRRTASINSAQLSILTLNSTHQVALQLYFTTVPLEFKLRKTMVDISYNSVLSDQAYKQIMFQSNNYTTLYLHTLQVISEFKAQALVTNMALFKNMLLTFNFDFTGVESTKVTYKIIDPQPIVRQWVKGVIFAENKYLAFTHTAGVYMGMDFNNRNVAFLYTNAPELSCWNSPLIEYEKMDVEPLYKFNSLNQVIISFSIQLVYNNFKHYYVYILLHHCWQCHNYRVGPIKCPRLVMRYYTVQRGHFCISTCYKC